jgi:hypothetical protein
MAPASKKPSKKAVVSRDPRIRSRVPLLESMSPELRNLLVGFLDAVLNLERAIEVYREEQTQAPQKDG